MIEPDSLKALGPYLAAFKAPPPESADPESVQKLHFVKLLSLDPNRTRPDAFYHKRLLTPIAKRCRKLLDQEPGRPSPFPSVLITVVSYNFGLVRLGIETLQAEHCLAFHTTNERIIKNAADVADEHERFTRAAGLDCHLMLQPIPQEPVAMLREFRKHVAQFVRETGHEADPGAIAFDVTPGTGLMTLAWAFVPPPGSWLLYLQSEYSKSLNGPVPFTETYLMWRAGDSWENHIGLPQPLGDNV